jgi:hypothetical protein
MTLLGSWPRVMYRDPLPDSKYTRDNYIKTLLMKNEPFGSKENPKSFIANLHNVKCLGVSKTDQIESLLTQFGNQKQSLQWFSTDLVDFHIDRNSQIYEGNVDIHGNKDKFGVLYSNEGYVEYEG